MRPTPVSREKETGASVLQALPPNPVCDGIEHAMTSPKTLLRAWNLKASKKLGQHFLADPSVAERIVAMADIHATDTVLEIGSGLGALTLPIARQAASVYAVEKDRRLIDLLRAELLLRKAANVHILDQDILQVDIGKMAAGLPQPLIVLGNLPYNISSQVLVRLIAQRNNIQRAVLMFQKELADRLKAGPGSKDYGRLTVMLKSCARVESLLRVAAVNFHPRPAVDSEVLEISFDREPVISPEREAYLFQVIKAAFGRRRKTLKNALAGSELGLSAAVAAHALSTAAIDANRRAETLSVAEFAALAHSLAELTGQPGGPSTDDGPAGKGQDG
jgi:16S rRNA (adenine1518-N6/adenine1519-N6)-dimethyltransferase